MNRQFESVEKLHVWANEITIHIDFHFTCVSYK